MKGAGSEVWGRRLGLRVPPVPSLYLYTGHKIRSAADKANSFQDQSVKSHPFLTPQAEGLPDLHHILLFLSRPPGPYPGLRFQEHMALHILAGFTVGHTSFSHGIFTERQKEKRC